MTTDGVIRLSEVQMERAGKRCGDAWLVQDISLAVRPGELYTLLGPPGSGKTTLLRMLAGFAPPDAGRIVVDDQPIDAVPPRKRNFGMVFQNHALWPHMTVEEHVAFGLRERGLGGEALGRKVATTLEQMGLAGFEKRRPADLTGSEPARVALARALAIQPRLLLLDDPLAGLEAPVRARMRIEVAKLQREVGITTIYATADQAEALTLSSRIAVLDHGRIAQEGKPEDVYWRPRNRFVAEFLGAVNLLPVRVVELRELGVVVETPGGAGLPVAAGGHAWTVGARGLLCLRPEALLIEEAERAHGGIPGTVAGYVFEGGRQSYDVSIGGCVLRVDMITSAAHGRGFHRGDRVKVQVSPDTSVLLPDDGGGSGRADILPGVSTIPGGRT